MNVADLVIPVLMAWMLRVFLIGMSQIIAAITYVMQIDALMVIGVIIIAVAEVADTLLHVPKPVVINIMVIQLLIVLVECVILQHCQMNVLRGFVVIPQAILINIVPQAMFVMSITKQIMVEKVFAVYRKFL